MTNYVDLTDDIGYELKDILIKALDMEDKTNLEIEARFGNIIDVFTSERIRINSLHPVILESSQDTKFKTGVAFNYFSKMKDIFADKTGVRQKDVVHFFKGFRTTCIDGKVSTIKKERKQVFDIYMPNAVYDVRIAVSKEIPVKNHNKSSTFRRERERETFSIDDFKFDFTAIKLNNNISYEVEVEVANSDFDQNSFINIILNMARTNK